MMAALLFQRRTKNHFISRIIHRNKINLYKTLFYCILEIQFHLCRCSVEVPLFVCSACLGSAVLKRVGLPPRISPDEKRPNERHFRAHWPGLRCQGQVSCKGHPPQLRRTHGKGVPRLVHRRSTELPQARFLSDAPGGVPATRRRSHRRLHRLHRCREEGRRSH